jgi:molybdopterin synthase sulfur carrier subunit
MTARLVFLGRLEDLAGAPERSVAPGPLEQVLAALPRDLAVILLEPSVRIALNGRLLTESGGITLGEGDELAFLPPVSGG